MTQDEVAKIINPQFPWVYAPTTALTKLVMNDGSIKSGYFNYTTQSAKFEKMNKLTFIEFGERAQMYRSTGDETYVTVIDVDDLVTVEYPSYPSNEINLKYLINNVDDLVKKYSITSFTTENLVRIVSNFRLDWGFPELNKPSDEFSPGVTKQIMLEGLVEKKLLTNKSYLNSPKKVISLASDYFNNNMLDKQLVINLHKFLFESNGEFRINDVIVHRRIQSDFAFIPPEKINNEIDALCDWYLKNSKSDFHPLLLAAMFHYQFVAIHPFDDGNGRLARILTSLILLKNRIPPPIVEWDDKIYYTSALEKADAGNIETWLIFLSRKVVVSLERMISLNRY